MATARVTARANRAYKRRPSKLKAARDLVLVILGAVLISALLKAFVVSAYFIPSASMENTLMIGDQVVVSQLTPSLFPLARGNVVVFRDSANWLRRSPAVAPGPPTPASILTTIGSLIGVIPTGGDDHLIKRIIGMPGDHIVCCTAAGMTTIDGHTLIEPYVRAPTPAERAANPAPEFDVVVPPGALWVMGDNRFDSADSRYHQNDSGRGFVPITDVVGRAMIVSWPVPRWSFLYTFPNVFGSG